VWECASEALALSAALAFSHSFSVTRAGTDLAIHFSRGQGGGADAAEHPRPAQAHLQRAVLRDYRIENVYREQDRQTTWLRENWLHPYASHENVWFAVCMFRQINWSPTLAEIGFPRVEWEPEWAFRRMEARRRRGEKVHTSAYRIPEHGCKSKAEYTVYKVLDPLWKAVERGNRPPWETDGQVSLEAGQKWLAQFYGWGDGFLTYEVITERLRSAYTISKFQESSARGLGSMSPQEVHGVKAPTLIIWGKFDKLDEPALSDLLTETIPGSRRVFIDDAGHMPQLEKPEEFNRIVTDLLKQQGTMVNEGAR
jgi:pimeloyl-ACP methyl ester carboxylesterase